MKEEEWWEDSPNLELQGTEENKTLGLYDQDSMMVETYSSPNQLEVYQNSNKNEFFQNLNESIFLKDDIVDAVLHELESDQIEQLQIENSVPELKALPYSTPELLPLPPPLRPGSWNFLHPMDGS